MTFAGRRLCAERPAFDEAFDPVVGYGFAGAVAAIVGHDASAMGSGRRGGITASGACFTISHNSRADKARRLAGHTTGRVGRSQESRHGRAAVADPSTRPVVRSAWPVAPPGARLGARLR